MGTLKAARGSEVCWCMLQFLPPSFPAHLGTLPAPNMCLQKLASSSCLRAGSKDSNSSSAHIRDDLQNTYVLLEEIGRGCFATVYKARHKITGALAAVKIIAASQTCTEEIDVMLRLDHPSCVKLHQIFQTDDQIQLVIDYVDGGDLFDAVAANAFEEERVRWLMQQLCEGIRHLHTKRIIHCDLKPENILLSADSVKLADFGLSKLIPDTTRPMSDMRCGGTSGYCAPEVLNQQTCGTEIDIWSCGVIFYIMLCGYPPFPMDMTPTSLAKVTNADFQFPAEPWSAISDSAKDLIGKMLVAQPNERLSIDGVLEHPWFAEATCETIPSPITTATRASDHSMMSLAKRARADLNQTPMRTPQNVSPLCSLSVYSPTPLSSCMTPVKVTETARKHKLKKEANRAKLLKNFKTTAALELAAALEHASAVVERCTELPLPRCKMHTLDVEMEFDLIHEPQEEKVEALVTRCQSADTTSMNAMSSCEAERLLTLCLRMDLDHFPLHGVGTTSVTRGFAFSCTVPYEPKVYTLAAAAA